MKLEKFFRRRKERISKIGRREEKNLTLKFFFALNIFGVLRSVLPLPIYRWRAYTKEEDNSYLEWKTKEAKIPLGISAILLPLERRIRPTCLPKEDSFLPFRKHGGRKEEELLKIPWWDERDFCLLCLTLQIRIIFLFSVGSSPINRKG